MNESTGQLCGVPLVSALVLEEAVMWCSRYAAPQGAPFESVMWPQSVSGPRPQGAFTAFLP
jgi:hypothetical protein